MDLNVFWFITLTVLFAGYLVFDGFDLGVGIVHLLVKGDQERRILLNSIGPVWDGNEVWLVTFGGALFAAFPHTYASTLSAFYLPVIFFLISLVLRGASIEFRSKEDASWWRTCWDCLFCFSSVGAAFIIGVAVGNVLIGIPINQNGDFFGSTFDLIRVFPISCGLMTVFLLALHGSLFLGLKTEGDLHLRILSFVPRLSILFLLFYFISLFSLFFYRPTGLDFTINTGLYCLLCVLLLLGTVKFPSDKSRFIASCLIVLLLVFGAADILFPNMLISSLNSAWSLTIYNSASSLKTLEIMRFAAYVGFPLIVVYSVVVYWVFRGKTSKDKLIY